MAFVGTVTAGALTCTSLAAGAGANELTITESSDDVTLYVAESDKDMIFKVNDGGSGAEVFRLDGSESSMLFAGTKKLTFGDAGTFIHQSSDGILTITSDATVDINGAVAFDGALTGITDITLNGTLTDGNYTFDGSGNVTGLGTVGCGAITSTGTTELAALTCTAAATFGGNYAGGSGATISTDGVGQFNGALTTDGALTADSIVVGGGYGSTGATISNAGVFQCDGAATVGGALTVNGNLYVSGSTVSVSSTSVNITGSFVFEGATHDAHETTLSVVEPTADATIKLPALDATTAYVAVFAANPAAVTVTATPTELNYLDNDNLVAGDITKLAAIDASAAEINLLDATAGSSVTLATGDGLLMWDANDSNAAKKVLMSDLEVFMEANLDTCNAITSATALVSVGAMTAGSIASGFGTIDNGSNTITTTGLGTFGSLDVDHVMIDGTTIGHTDDTDLITLSAGVVTVAGNVVATNGQFSEGLSGSACSAGTLAVASLGAAGDTGLISFAQDTATMAGGSTLAAQTLTAAGATINTSLTCNGSVTIGNATSDRVSFTSYVTSSIIPSDTTSFDLGSTDLRWNNIYTGDLSLANERGDWTVIEEENYLTLRNNKTGGRFKLVMEALEPGEYGPGNDGMM